MNAALAGGVRIIEFTLTTPDAYAMIEKFSKRSDLESVDGMSSPLVGAGTVLTTEQARRAVDAGASFLVSPICDPTVIEEAGKLGVAMMPGTHTPTEMVQAHRAGAPLCKLFPAPADGPAWLRALLGPLPFLRVVPTQGVDEGNIAEWLQAGAWAVGLVGSLFKPEDMQAERFTDIEARARSMRAAAMTLERTGPPSLSAPW